MHSALVGFGLGFFVALQLGPMSLFLIRSTLRAGLLTGLGVGAGIAVVDALYATAGAAGAAPLYQAFRTSLGATASNPTTIVSWAAIFSAASPGMQAVPLVAGVGIGSLTWVTLLAVVTALVRRAVGVRAIRIADGIAGVGLIGFGGVLGWRTLHDA